MRASFGVYIMMLSQGGRLFGSLRVVRARLAPATSRDVSLRTTATSRTSQTPSKKASSSSPRVFSSPPSRMMMMTPQPSVPAHRRRALALISSGLTIEGARRAGLMRRYATVESPVAQPSSKGGAMQPPPTHPAFALLKTEEVKEYGTTCYVYEHEKTKAQVLSVIAPEDENKVFGITFRTPPPDSTGLPHILEHSVLCGSRAFPTKEPFVELLKGSLQTFLNAFTYPDRTCYPVASQNDKDLENLIRVYLDAVFHPRAVNDPMVLKQEGWHYELTDSDDLEYKGVVYNEMKGVYSSPDALMQRAAQQALFPDNAYAVDSGGDPEIIPKLSFEQFREFHSSYYHPSNSRVFFYGDDDPQKRLALVDEYLDEFSQKSKDTRVSLQPLSIKEPETIDVPFPSGDAKSRLITMNWLLVEEPLSPKDELGLAVLDHLLVGTPTSTLRKALTDAGLGESVIASGLSDELVQPTFSVGVRGVASREDCEKVEEVILKTLQDLADTGFDFEDVEASLNTIEFQLREFNTGSFPKGLSYMLGAMRNWIYDRDPVEALRFEQPLQELLAEKSPDDHFNSYFKNMIKTLLLDNSHRVSVFMVPDAELEDKAREAEAQRLQAIKEEMSTDDLSTVKIEMDELRRLQSMPDSPEALKTIPTLDAKTDLKREVRIIARDESDLSQRTTLLTRSLPTAGILYADVAMDLTKTLSIKDEVPLIPLFSRMLTETGISNQCDAVQLQRKIGARTGGISASILNTMKVEPNSIADPEDVVYQLVIRGKATKDKVSDLFSLYKDILLSANFEDSQQRVVEILKESKARYESAFRTSGQAFAAARIGAGLTRSGYLAEVTSGVTHYDSTLKALDQAQNDWPSLLEKLETMRKKILETSEIVVNLTGDDSTLHAARESVETFAKESFPLSSSEDKVSSSSATLASTWATEAPLSEFSSATSEGFAVPTQVNYVAKGGRFYAPGTPPKGADSVIRRVLSLDYLWNQVRVVGGAYGGSCSINPVSGNFAFSSYRDPNLYDTLQVYDKAVEYLDALDLDQSELDKAIIASIGDLDSPLTPDQKGFQSLRHYLDGTTDEIRQQWRDEVLQTSKADFKVFGEKLAAMLASSSSKAVVFASKAALDEANANLPEDEKIQVTTLLN